MKLDNNGLALFAMGCVTLLMSIAMLMGVITNDGVFLGSIAAMFGMLAGKKLSDYQKYQEVPNYGPAEDNTRTGGE